VSHESPTVEKLTLHRTNYVAFSHAL